MKTEGHASLAEQGLRVRPMCADDLSRVLEIEQEAFSTPWSYSSFRSLLPRPEVLLRVLEEVSTERILGYSVIWSGGEEGELANFALSRRVRGRGLGGRFLDALIAEARSMGIAWLFLEVRDSNTPAQRLYASRGFREVGRRRGYYSQPREDALVLMKEL